VIQSSFTAPKLSHDAQNCLAIFPFSKEEIKFDSHLWVGKIRQKERWKSSNINEQSTINDKEKSLYLLFFFRS
jgi:hypothetical protein